MAEGRWSGRSRHRADSRRKANRAPLAVGWGGHDGASRGATVVAAFERGRLSEGLARLHGHGFGPSARVLDGARGDLAGQLSRAGLPPDLAARLVGDEQRATTSLLVVHAPAHGTQVVELLQRSGAGAVAVVPPGPAAEPATGAVVEAPADVALAEAGA